MGKRFSMAGRLGSIFLAVLAAGACHKPGNPAISKGSKVKINYALNVDGKMVDSSAGKQPLAFVQGAGQIVPGLEEQLEGLQAGAKKSVTVPPEKGYGQVNPAAVQKVPKTAFRDAPQLSAGRMVTITQGNRQFPAMIKSVGAKDVTLDFNHPLAGKTLQFDIEIVEVQTQ